MASLRVAFQGEHGAFSEDAAAAWFRSGASFVPLRSFDDVFGAVDAKRADYGVVPIENSLFGSIHQNYDLLERHRRCIAGEIKLRIVHALIALPGVLLRNVRQIYSHPQALGQCDRFLKRLKGREAVADYDTAGAVKRLKEQRRTDAAAIAGVGAARKYGMTVLKTGIESDHRNFTRFLVLSRRPVRAKGPSKTSIIFTVKNSPGALFKSLSVFALRDINLFKIESRPMIGKPWHYLFYLDFAGSMADRPCRHAVDHLRETSPYVKNLGSYPIGRTVN
jgi:prephenate dehydratase